MDCKLKRLAQVFPKAVLNRIQMRGKDNIMIGKQGQQKLMAMLETVLQKTEKKSYFWMLLNIEGSFIYKFTSSVNGCVYDTLMCLEAYPGYRALFTLILDSICSNLVQFCQCDSFYWLWVLVIRRLAFQQQSSYIINMIDNVRLKTHLIKPEY